MWQGLCVGKFGGQLEVCVGEGDFRLRCVDCARKHNVLTFYPIAPPSLCVWGVCVSGGRGCGGVGWFRGV